MYFKVLTWESIGWEESTVSSTKRLTRLSDKKLELPRPQLSLLVQLANWDLWFMDKLLNIAPSSSLEEVSPLLKSELLASPQLLPVVLVSLLITEDITRMLIIKPLMYRDSPPTNPSSCCSQDMLELPRREKSTIPLLNNWRTQFKTLKTVSWLSQPSSQDASQRNWPLQWKTSRLTGLSELTESTRDTKERDRRHWEMLRPRRSERASCFDCN